MGGGSACFIPGLRSVQTQGEAKFWRGPGSWPLFEAPFLNPPCKLALQKPGSGGPRGISYGSVRWRRWRALSTLFTSGEELKRRDGLVLIFVSFMNQRSPLCPGKKLRHPVGNVQQAFGGAGLERRKEGLPGCGLWSALVAPQRKPPECRGARERSLGHLDLSGIGVNVPGSWVCVLLEAWCPAAWCFLSQVPWGTPEK